MKYRTKSAEVLNEADRAQRILDWQLFCLDQEAILYAPGHWQPGDNLFMTPLEIRDAVDADAEYFNDYADEEIEEFGVGFWGNCVRPMIQTYEYLDEEDIEEGFYGNLMERAQHWPEMRCEPCGVDWGREDGDNCWICGESYPWPKRFNPKSIFGVPHVSPFSPPIGEIEDVRMTIGGIEVVGRLHFDLQSFVAPMHETAEALQRMTMRETMRPNWDFIERMLGFRSDHMRYSIADARVTQDLYRMRRYQPPVPPSNPFEREEREIVLVESGIADLEDRPRGDVSIPTGWMEVALQRTIDPRYIPNVDHLREYTQVQQSAWPGVEIVTERRRS